MRAGARQLRTFLPVETKTCLAISDGRELILQRGTVACHASYQKIGREALSLDWDVVACTLAVPDRQGRVFSLERSIGANWLLELLRTSQHDPVGDLSLVLEGIRCYHDHRVWIPTTGRVGDELVTLAYWAKQLDAVLDLLSFRLGEWEHLAIRVNPISNGAIGYKPSPQIVVATDWAAKVVLWPSMLGGAYGPLGEQPVFVPTGERGEPQPLVEVV